MKRTAFALVSAIGLLLVVSPALAAFIFRAGDAVYVDGKKYDWEEWKKIRDDPELVKQSQQPEPANQVTGPRAATCTTEIYYDEFPSEDERFRCSASLGALTREQILEKGWKVDFIEKIPPAQGQPAQSPRGLPLNLYKLVISRPSASAPSAPLPPVQARPSPSSKITDSLCLNDCLRSGGSRGFCDDRCTH